MPILPPAPQNVRPYKANGEDGVALTANPTRSATRVPALGPAAKWGN